jgi:HPt (histidine-containing phosphotransfer) domain-containing protein
MKHPINFPDLFNRVSDNKEFAHRMLTTFFDSYNDRYNALQQNLQDEKYDDLADGAHQLKGILGNLALNEGFDLLKTIHEQARLGNKAKLESLLKTLDKSIRQANEYFLKSQDLF